MAKKKPADPSAKDGRPRGEDWHNGPCSAGLKNLRMWQPGQSGNPRGPKPGRKLTDILREALDAQTLCGEPMPEGITVGEALVQVALRHAFEGDSSLIREFLQRIDGRVPEQIELSLSHMTDDELIARATGRAGRAGAEGADGPEPGA